MPRGVHGSGASSPSTSRPRLTGCRPSASLSGSMRSRAAFSSSCLRQRELHDVAGAVRVGVELVDVASSCSCVVSPGRSRRIEVMPTFAQSLCLPRT